MENFNNKKKNKNKKILRVASLNAAAIVLFVFLAVLFMQIGNSFDAQTALATTESAMPQSSSDTNTGEGVQPGDPDVPGDTENTDPNPDDTEGEPAPDSTDDPVPEESATDSPANVTTASPIKKTPHPTRTPHYTKTAHPTKTPVRKTPTATATVPSATVPATKAPTAKPTATQQTKPSATATVPASATGSATASVLPTATPKPTLITPSPTLMGLEEPVVSGSAVIDVESEDYTVPSISDIPAELNPDATDNEFLPEETASVSGTDKTESKGSISTLFDALVYVFAFCAIISAIYGVYITVKFIVVKVKTAKKNKAAKSAESEGSAKDKNKGKKK